MKIISILFLSAIFGTAGGIFHDLFRGTRGGQGGRGRGRDRRPNYSAAEAFGRGRASELWNHGKYICTLPAVVTKFWSDVKKIVFPDCDHQYGLLWAAQSNDCKTGAKNFVIEQANACVSYDDCLNLGTTAAVGVAYKVCGAFAHRAPPSFFPPNCISIAKNKCKFQVTHEINRLSQKKQCGGVDVLHFPVYITDYECEYEVDTLVNQAALP